MEDKYTDVIIDERSKYRIFNENVDVRELLWHQDEKDRKVIVFGGEGWKIQFDNELPIELKEGDEIIIKNHIYHRVIKGKKDLVIKIIE